MAEPRKMPEQVSEENIGVTQSEQDWRNLPDPRPPVSRWVFFFVGLAIIIAFALSGLWYYHVNIVPEKRFARAVNYLNDGDYTGAYRLFVEVYEVKPKRKDVIYNLGCCLEQMGRYEAAANRYREQLKKVPYHAKAMQNLGALYVFKLDNPEEGMTLLKRGAEKLNTVQAWENVIAAAKKLNNRDEIINALKKESDIQKNPDEIVAVANRLFALQAYEEALDTYKKALDKDGKSQEAQAGIKTAREKLGLPDSTEHTIIPGSAFGKIELDSSKEQVKEQFGSPEKKLFTKYTGRGEYANEQVEIWSYGLKTPDKFSIIFIKGKAVEIETASKNFKTEEGLSVENFTDERFAEEFNKQSSKESHAVIYTLKDGGLAFYAETDRKGNISDRYRKLRVFKTKQSAFDNAKRFLLLKLHEK